MTEFARLFFKEMPKSFKYETFLNIAEGWKSDQNITDVRAWLFQLNIPLDQNAYMLCDENIIKENRT